MVDFFRVQYETDDKRERPLYEQMAELVDAKGGISSQASKASGAW